MTRRIAETPRRMQWPHIAACFSLAAPALLAGCGMVETRDPSPPPPLIEQLSEDDMRLADRTLQQALSVAISGTTFAWRNTANGYAGTVTPKSSFRTDDRVFCRTYVETVSIEQRSELYENSACMDDAGVWKSVR